MSQPKDANHAPRVAPSSYNEQGNQVFEWSLSSLGLTDLVELPVGPDKVLPVIFVPGIMGSNLKSVTEEGEGSEAIWRLDKGLGGQPEMLVRRWGGRNAGKRQKELHPKRTVVDDAGAVPKMASGTIRGSNDELQSRYRARGWGEVAETSYHEFLVWLENALNCGTPPHKWKYFPAEPRHLKTTVTPTDTFQLSRTTLIPGLDIAMPGLPAGLQEQIAPIMTSELLSRARFTMPVHAFGYNWLESNKVAAERLAERIAAVIAQYGGRCEKVAIVTHSMGGLVARCCAQLPGLQAKIAGVVHGVMPATGAAVAYRRCKLGVKEESYAVGAIMGWNGREVSAVFAQAPGALQLLPSAEYGMGWLKVADQQGAVHVQQPAKDPYTDIYLRKDRWWGLLREEWLRPPEGTPITWDEYRDNIERAKLFHGAIAGQYHPHTYVYYGADPAHPSFSSITWKLEVGNILGSSGSDAATVSGLGFHEVVDTGTNPLHAGRETSTHYTREGVPFTRNAHRWIIRCAMQDGTGDGTVPANSGAAPLRTARSGHVRVQARLPGFDHEPAYKDAGVQQFTLYCLIKIASST